MRHSVSCPPHSDDTLGMQVLRESLKTEEALNYSFERLKMDSSLRSE
jgi:hypothetical protein